MSVYHVGDSFQWHATAPDVSVSMIADEDHVFPVVHYGCQTWTVGRAERAKISIVAIEWSTDRYGACSVAE